MSDYNITFFQVGTGNCCLMSIDGMNMVFDLHAKEDENAYDLIKSFLPNENGKYQLDVLCISHGHKDHCGGFRDFKDALDNNNLEIGSIWHPNYDRTKVEDNEDISEDYVQLHNEITSRINNRSNEYGKIQVPLTAWMDEEKIFKGLNKPENISVKVLSPYIKDEDKEEEWDVNDLSLVLNIEISGLSILFPGDSGARIWQDRIIPYTLENDKYDRQDWASADIFVTSHHGSYSIFGNDRENVRNTEEEPENYELLNYIKPNNLLVSAKEKFPLDGDSNGDQPPHYAAWKWYHQWFQDNKDVDQDDKHPTNFLYTSEGDIRLEKKNDEWILNNKFSRNKEAKDESKGFKKRKGRSQRPGSRYGY